MAAKEIVTLGETPGGKKIQFVRGGKIGLIQFDSGGELPAKLQGGWTDIKNAQTAVNSYLREAEIAAAELEDKPKRTSRAAK